MKEQKLRSRDSITEKALSRQGQKAETLLNTKRAKRDLTVFVASLKWLDSGVKLRDCVKVARMALNHLVGVRIPVPQIFLGFFGDFTLPPKDRVSCRIDLLSLSIFSLGHADILR